MSIQKKQKSSTSKAWLASSDEDYQKLNLKKGMVEVWEDGMRTSGDAGTYEWWYFDCKLSDGSTMVIGFYTKLLTDLDKPLKPLIMMSIDYTDGTKLEKTMQDFSASDFSSSKEKCEVTIGKNYFKGNLEAYEIHVEDGEFKVDVKVSRETESWRPETGYMMFGDDGDFFAWVVAVPQGQAQVSYTQDGKENNLTGSCYHDHNWGNKSLAQIINHWYWSRAEVGPYTVIASEIIAEEEYNYSSILVYNLSKDGKMAFDDGTKVKLLRQWARPDEKTGKPMANELMFIYESDTDKFELTLQPEKTLLDIWLIQQEPLRLMSKFLTGFDGAYLRFAGTARLLHYQDGKVVENLTNSDAVWELMFMGN